MITTIEHACKFVKKVKICTIFNSNKVKYTSLWENVDLPDKQRGEKGWGERMNAVWTWKAGLPAEYPNEIYYGKIKGGFAVLMDMDYMANEHFPHAYRLVNSLSQLAQLIHGKIAIEPWYTSALRKSLLQEIDFSKGQFDTALKNLQITMNIVRLNDPQIEQDKWILFRELYLDVWNRYVDEDI